MSFMGGFAQGLAGGLSNQIQNRQEELRTSIANYRQMAQTAYQTYVKSMNSQQALKRQAQNLATQYFDGNEAAARTFLELNDNDITKANKAILEYGVPQVISSGPTAAGPTLDEQAAEMGFSPAGQPVEQAAADPAQKGVMDHVMGIGKKLFGPVDISEVRAHVAAEMGMDPEKLQGIMAGAYSDTPAFTPVQLQQNRLGLGDVSNPEAALLRMAMMDPESLSPAMRQVQAEARRMIADRNASHAASGTPGGPELWDKIFATLGRDAAFEENPRLNANQHRQESRGEVSPNVGDVAEGYEEGTVIEAAGKPDLIVRNGRWDFAP